LYINSIFEVASFHHCKYPSYSYLTSSRSATPRLRSSPAATAIATFISSVFPFIILTTSPTRGSRSAPKAFIHVEISTALTLLSCQATCLARRTTFAVLNLLPSSVAVAITNRSSADPFTTLFDAVDGNRIVTFKGGHDRRNYVR
jgi:hypothetical protein